MLRCITFFVLLGRPFSFEAIGYAGPNWLISSWERVPVSQSKADKDKWDGFSRQSDLSEKCSQT